MRLTWIIIVFSCVFSTALAGSALGQPQSIGSGTAENPFVVPKTDSRIRVDAILDEEAWEKALLLELNYEVRPGENVPPPVRTEVLLVFDDQQCYAAFRCYDPEPRAILAHLRDRDSLGGDDWVALVLDTFNDQRQSFAFIVTAAGVQCDRIETPEIADDSWDTIWESSGRITDWGYIVEIAIPFSSLRFQRKHGPQIWGFDAVRLYPRNHAYQIGLFPRDRSNNCYLCQAIKIKGFEGARPGRNIEINPTATAVRTDGRAEFPHGNMEKQVQEAEVGLTARWGMTPNLTFNATANPDFSQVEADAMQLDINEPFALFYWEKRPFFTEGAEYFRSLESVVYTRTMRDPAWGLKLTGKQGANTIGAYAVRDDITNLIFPGNQSSQSTSLSMANTSSVFRYKRDFGSRYTIGLLATDREGEDYYNRVFGLDCNFLLTQKDQIQLLIMGSHTKYPEQIVTGFDQPDGPFSDRLISFEYDHESRTWGWWADYEEAGSNFRADLGFIPRVGYRNVEGGWNYTWNAQQGKWWSLARVGGDLQYFGDLDGDLLSNQASLWFSYSGAMRSRIYSAARRSRQTYNAREFDITSFSLEGGFWPTGTLNLSVFTILGDRIDYANTRLGRRIQFSPYFSYNVGQHLRVSFDHTFERMTIQKDRLYTANISQLTVVYQFNVRTFFRSTFQYVDYNYNSDLYTFEIDPEYKQFFTQLLFSYKINARTVIFIGYTNNYYGGSDFRLTQADRTFFIKLGYAWVI